MSKVQVQSITFDRERWTIPAAKKWLRDNGYKDKFRGKSADVTPSRYRFRQHDPKRGARYWIRSTKSGIQFVMQEGHPGFW